MFIGGFLAYITFANEQKTINKRKEIQNEVIKEVKDDMNTIVDDEKFIVIVKSVQKSGEILLQCRLGQG